MSTETTHKLADTVDYIRFHYKETPEVAIILGSGLGNFISEIKISLEIDYSSIPHFP